MNPMSNPSTQPPVRVLIVDDHIVVRQGLDMLLRNQPDLEVVGHAGTREEALALAAAHLPDVVLLDVNLGKGRDGLDLLRPLGGLAPPPKILVLTGVDDVSVRGAAFQGGAHGLVLKTDPATTVIAAIRKVRQGELCFQPVRVDPGAEGDPTSPAWRDDRTARLTARERELIALVGQGLSNEQMARRLFISANTVRNHLTSIFEKLGVHDRLQLAVLAYRTGLAKLPD